MKKTLLIAMAASMAACCGKKDAAQAHTPVPQSGAAVTSPRALVYRTKSDHHDHVPVLLSADRSRIVSYPHPKDLRTANGFPVPTPLGKNYLLDNRGIGPNMAYLRLTYEEYAALPEAPSLEKLESFIIDRDPLVELCDCGQRAEFKDITKELSAWVEAGELLKHCKKLK